MRLIRRVHDAWKPQRKLVMNTLAAKNMSALPSLPFGSGPRISMTPTGLRVRVARRLAAG